MAPRLAQGEIWNALVPYNDQKSMPVGSKVRPVIIIGMSLQSPHDDAVVLVVPVTSFAGTPRPLHGDIEISDWSSCGLAKRSWVRARRVWGMNPKAIIGPGAMGRVSSAVIQAIYAEISGLL